MKTGELPATPAFAQVNEIVMSRCSMCHAAEPVWAGIAAAPKGIRLDNPAAIRLHARVIAINAARSSAMPPGNVTEMTDGRAPGAGRVDGGRRAGPMTTFSLEQLNAMSEADFTAALGDIFEHSPWVAKATSARRPFATLAALA